MKIRKRLLTALLSLSIVAFNITLGGISAKSITDTTPPTLTSVSINKTTATSGDILTVIAKVQDDISGIKSATIFFNPPGGNANRYITLNKDANGDYSGTTAIGKYDAIGTWTVKYISLVDNANNYGCAYNSEVYTTNSNAVDLSMADFYVSGTLNDITAPTITGMSISKTTAILGETVTVTINATDDISGILNVCIIYDSQSGKAYKYITLYKVAEGVYSGNFKILSTDPIGTWSVRGVSMIDNTGNSKIVYNKATFPTKPMAIDFSSIDLRVIRK